MINSHLISLGRANLWFRAAKEALADHLNQCPENEHGHYDYETGYAQSHCVFPKCFTYHDEEGTRRYADERDMCAHCIEARRLSNLKYAARIGLSKRRGVVLRLATNEAKDASNER